MNETNHPARRLRHGERPTEPLVFDDAAANKAAEEGDKLPPLGIKNDRDMLLYLMQAFDNEMSVCGRCGHEESTSTCDSAGFLREYLASVGECAKNSERVSRRAEVGALMPCGAMIANVYEAYDAGLRASRQVANKAEVEPVAEVIEECVSGTGIMARAVKFIGSAARPGDKLYVAPPATTGASTAVVREILSSIVEDGFMSETNSYRARRALDEPVGASTVLTDERIVNAGSMPPDEDEMKSAAFELAKWLSAALDDENVCLEYKAAINSWFNAAMPSAHVAIESGTQYIMDAISYYAESKDGRTLDRIRAMVNEGELAREVAAQAGQVAVPEGFAIVPRAINEDMHVAAVRAIHRATGNDDAPSAIWSAMISAAPSPAKESK